MAIRDGLLGNPVLSGLLARGGPVAIQQAANQQIARMQQRPQAARLRAPGAINLPPDNSVGQGLSQLGKALGDIADMKEQGAAKKDLADLFGQTTTVQEPGTGQTASVPRTVTSGDIYKLMGKYINNPSIQKSLGLQAQRLEAQERQTSNQAFQEKMFTRKQDLTISENQKDRDLKKEINIENQQTRLDIANNNIASNEKIAGLKMDNAWQVATLKAGKGKTFAETMTFQEFRKKHGSPGLKLPGTTFADNDAVEVVYNNDGTMRGYTFKTKDIVITSEGAFSKTKESQRMGNPSSSGGVNNNGMIGPSAGGASGGPVNLPKPDWKGAAGVITGTINQIWDRGKEALGFSDTEKPSAVAAARSLKALNNQVIITVATTNAILQKSGKITDFGRKLTQESLPGLGIGQSEAGFENEVKLVVQRLESSRNQLRTIQEQSTNKKAQREAGDKAIALDGLAKEYRKILESLEPASNRSNNSSIINSADSIVGIN